MNNQLSLGKQLWAKANQQAKELIEAFDLLEQLHLDTLEFTPEDTVELYVSAKTRKVELAEIEEAIRNLLREKLPEKLFNTLLQDILTRDDIHVPPSPVITYTPEERKEA